MRRIALAMLLGVPLLTACDQQSDVGQEAGEPAAESMAAGGTDTSAATAQGLIPGTPPGGLAQWVEDIRTGLEAVPAQAAEDRALAQRTALDLYIGRQEYLELYYGEVGRFKATQALADAITADERAFHRILEMVNPAAAGRPTPEQIQAQIDTLDARLDEVMEEAEAAGVDVSEPKPVSGN